MRKRRSADWQKTRIVEHGLDDRPLGFGWDHDKARANARKHGVSFGEATTAFDDPAALLEADSAHSEGEERQRLIGRSIPGQVMVVVFVERPGTIRIISARLARRSEWNRYEQEAHERGF